MLTALLSTVFLMGMVLLACVAIGAMSKPSIGSPIHTGTTQEPERVALVQASEVDANVPAYELNENGFRAFKSN